MRCSTWPSKATLTFWALMVMPRSRSMSIESRYCSFIKRGSTAPVISKIRSERVDLPWSTWLMIEKLRISEIWSEPAGVFGGTICQAYRAPGSPQAASH